MGKVVFKAGKCADCGKKFYSREGSLRTKCSECIVTRSSPESNPKDRAARAEGRPQYSTIPLDTILEGDARVHMLGAEKYGRLNWRKDKVKQTTYLDAMVSHMRKYAAGEEVDDESGYSHLYHIRACCAILLDAEQHKTLIHDLQEYESK